MEEKYFRFNAADDREDTLWGYAKGNGRYITADEKDITLKDIKKVDFETAKDTLANWIGRTMAIAYDDDIDEVVSLAFSEGKTVGKFRELGEYYICTIEATDNPLVDWEEIEEGFDEDFTMPYDADSDVYVRESKKVKKNRLKEDTAFLCTNKPKDENRDLPEWVYQKFGKIYESCNK
jgi:hypothetical protein